MLAEKVFTLTDLFAELAVLRKHLPTGKNRHMPSSGSSVNHDKMYFQNVQYIYKIANLRRR